MGMGKSEELQEEGGNCNIALYVNWIHNIFKADVSVSSLLRIEAEKEKKRKRKIREEDEKREENVYIKLKKNDNSEKKDKPSIREKVNFPFIMHEGEKRNDLKEEHEKAVGMHSHLSNERSTPFHTLATNVKNSLHTNRSEHDFLNKDELKSANFLKSNSSSSCDISEIESDEELHTGVVEESIAGAMYGDATKMGRNYQALHGSYDNVYATVLQRANQNAKLMDLPNIIDFEILSDLMLYPSDDEEADEDGGSRGGETDGSANGRKTKTDNVVRVSFNCDKFKKNTDAARELDAEFFSFSMEAYKNSEKKEGMGERGSLNASPEDLATADSSRDRGENKNVSDNFDNGTVCTSSAAHLRSPIEGGDADGDNDTVNLKRNEKGNRQDVFPPKNMSHNFCFWNVENGTYITKPLYAQRLNKKTYTLLDESEEMIKNYSSNKYSIKFVPRHLLYVVSQVASRTFFDPIYRKQLLFQF
ncbi:conserved Plasmodium protein, unknown function [Plasmodium ovale wallikeri]|uniref:Uncharacterized protein n=2 Tax=Plasmodium ovale TaxID=36330 RepID=A0A1A8YLI2_PLAOA|nr:conserved Plasmodium protein, unknown function [Plasmodium ovale wallikeri]SBT32425.1 conserved Plasmodium protein, unknown function [Plasmodium ovale wallikeri]SBT75753.1 conserved Plasmodium protein, unknown function [Plasmodium ovale]